MSTRVDFYILEGNGNREITACRLSEKAYKQGYKIYIHADSQQHVRRLDELLWTFRDGSFVPHEILSGAPESDNPVPILIGCDTEPAQGYSMLLNLASEIPAFYHRFERIADIVNQEESIKTAGRKRFAAYRDQGCDLHHHTI